MSHTWIDKHITAGDDDEFGSSSGEDRKAISVEAVDEARDNHDHS